MSLTADTHVVPICYSIIHCVQELNSSISLRGRSKQPLIWPVDILNHGAGCLQKEQSVVFSYLRHLRAIWSEWCQTTDWENLQFKWYGTKWYGTKWNEEVLTDKSSERQWSHSLPARSYDQRRFKISLDINAVQDSTLVDVLTKTSDIMHSCFVLIKMTPITHTGTVISINCTAQSRFV